MLEKDIENLIARYPDEFFPKSGYKLLGQQVKPGNYNAGILFENKDRRRVIVEVKRGILTPGGASDIIKQYGLLQSEKPDNIAGLVLCANTIPREIKAELKAAGIKTKKLSIHRICQVAQKYGYEFMDSGKLDGSTALRQPPVSNAVWIFQADGLRYDLINALADEEIGEEMHWTVKQYRREIARGHTGIIWLSGKEGGIFAITELVTDPGMLAEHEAEKKYWTNPAEGKEAQLRVKMRIVRNLLNRPVTRETIKNTPGLEQLSILKFSSGTNFPVRREEWMILKDLLQV